METMMQAWRISVVASALAAVICLGGPAAAQLEAARDEVERTTDQGAASQDRIDDISGDTEELVRNYRTILRQLEDLREYNRQREELIAAQEEEKESIRAQIERVKTIERDIVPLMTRMIEGLTRFVELDVPVRSEERARRVESLQALLTRSDVNIAEKFRLVLQAYQTENDYGRKIEAYKGAIELDGVTKEVDFLMIGRAAFFYQTLDQSETAIWSQDSRSWELLDSRFADQIRTAIDMANEFIPPELLILPIYGAQASNQAN